MDAAVEDLSSLFFFLSPFFFSSTGPVNTDPAAVMLATGGSQLPTRFYKESLWGLLQGEKSSA